MRRIQRPRENIRLVNMGIVRGRPVIDFEI